MSDLSKPIGVVYAEEQDNGSWVFGVGPNDYELMRQGYGCMNCLEKFLVGGSLIQLTRCPTCKARVEPDIAPLPEDWASHIKQKEEALSSYADAPKRRR